MSLIHLSKEFGLCSSRSLVFPLRMRFCAKFLVGAVMSFSGFLSAQQVDLYGVSARLNELYQIDLETGVATLVGEDGLGGNLIPGALASDLVNGRVWTYYNNQDSIHRVNVSNGTIGEALALDFGELSVDSFRNVGLAYDPGRDLIYLSDLSAGSTTPGSLYSIDPDSGVVSLIGEIPINVSSLAFDTANDVLYGVTGYTDLLYTIDPETALSVQVGSLGFNANTSGLAFDSETETLYLTEANSDSLYTVNTSTGEATLVGALGGDNINILGLTFVASEEVMELRITAVDRIETLTRVNFVGATEQEYVLQKSLDLDFNDAVIVDRVTLSDGMGIMEDDAATEEQAFYRVEVAQ